MESEQIGKRNDKKVELNAKEDLLQKRKFTTCSTLEAGATTAGSGVGATKCVGSGAGAAGAGSGGKAGSASGMISPAGGGQNEAKLYRDFNELR